MQLLGMQHYSKLIIEYADPQDLSDSVGIPFILEDNPIVQKWINKVICAKRKYNIDDPTRFYGFGTLESQIEFAMSSIEKCIDTINSHKHIIDRKLTDINDQDTLNYLHHIFEVYHGLLDQQTHEFYISAPEEVKIALANLNVLVHRCESVSRGAYPRHVVTWYGLPKTDMLDIEDYEYFTDDCKFGTVYLNYVEIGKTLEDLAHDNDEYIADDAFKPFRHYSADFNVKFYNSTYAKLLTDRKKIYRYYQENRSFFENLGLEQGHAYLKPGSIPLARINYVGDFEHIKEKQYVKSVTFE